MIRATCPDCRHQYQLDETKFPRDVVSVTCSQCQTKFNVRKDGGQPAAVLGPKALIAGAEVPGLADAIRATGLEPIQVADPSAARDFFLREFPPVVVVSPPQLTPPPLADFSPLLAASPADRRRGFFILVADKLRTLDGNAAFLYGVNLVISTRDLSRFEAIYREAMNHHDSLYAAMRVANAPGLA